MVAGFAEIDAEMILKAFGKNADGVLDGEEIAAWRDIYKKLAPEWSWNQSEESNAVIRKAWSDSQLDGDEFTGNQDEIAPFLLKIWDLMASENTE